MTIARNVFDFFFINSRSQYTIITRKAIIQHNTKTLFPIIKTSHKITVSQPNIFYIIHDI